jgi:hypothetical protein
MDHFIDGILESFSQEVLLTQFVFDDAHDKSFYHSKEECAMIPWVNYSDFNKDYEPPLHKIKFKLAA